MKDTMHKSIDYSRSVKVLKEVDVLIAGGGPSGIAAAIAAKKAGVSVFLAEAQGCFGGMGTSGLVPNFCQFGDGVNFIAAGVGKDVYDRMFEEGGSGPDDADRDCKEVCINSEVLKRIYDSMMIGAGVQFQFFTNIIDVVSEDYKINFAICWGKSGLFGIKAKVYVDCTGDGDVAALAGAEFSKGDSNGRMQPATLCSKWANVDWQKTPQDDHVYVREQLKKALADDDIFTIKDPHLPGMWKITNDIAGGNLGHIFGADATCQESMTSAMIEGRRHIPEYERFYKKYVPGFQKCELVSTGALLGCRESRIVVGEYILNVEDFRRRAAFEDEIGRYCYPIDVHPPTPSKEDYAIFEKEFFEIHRYKYGESYGIPYRILTPKKFDNLLVGGRCVSADRYVQGSIRVMPGCFITGQAAGSAAALAVEQKCCVREIDIKQLQYRLVSLGAYLPNYTP